MKSSSAGIRAFMRQSDTTPNMADLGSVATELDSESSVTYIAAETEQGTKVIEAAIPVWSRRGRPAAT